MDHYRHYHTVDFVWDHSFRQWVLHPTPASDRIWNRWLCEHPSKACQVQVAREIILAIQCDSTTLDTHEIKAMVREVLNKIT
jgi:transmembrane sensor